MITKNMSVLLLLITTSVGSIYPVSVYANTQISQPDYTRWPPPYLVDWDKKTAVVEGDECGDFSGKLYHRLPPYCFLALKEVSNVAIDEQMDAPHKMINRPVKSPGLAVTTRTGATKVAMTREIYFEGAVDADGKHTAKAGFKITF